MHIYPVPLTGTENTLMWADEAEIEDTATSHAAAAPQNEQVASADRRGHWQPEMSSLPAPSQCCLAPKQKSGRPAWPMI